ncbi:MAG: Spy/CpxP family protein refolding chaperone, partial [Myxococcota bacterium]
MMVWVWDDMLSPTNQEPSMTRTLYARAVALALLVASPAAMAFPGPPPMGPPPGERLEMMFDEVDADEEQRATIREVVSATVEEIRAIHEEGHAIRDGLRDAFTAETIDRVLIEDYRQRVLDLVDQGTGLVFDGI